MTETQENPLMSTDLDMVLSKNVDSRENFSPKFITKDVKIYFIKFQSKAFLREITIVNEAKTMWRQYKTDLVTVFF